MDGADSKSSESNGESIHSGQDMELDSPDIENVRERSSVSPLLDNLGQIWSTGTYFFI